MIRSLLTLLAAAGALLASPLAAQAPNFPNLPAGVGRTMPDILSLPPRPKAALTARLEALGDPVAAPAGGATRFPTFQGYLTYPITAISSGASWGFWGNKGMRNAMMARCCCVAPNDRKVRIEGRLRPRRLSYRCPVRR